MFLFKFKASDVKIRSFSYALKYYWNIFSFFNFYIVYVVSCIRNFIERISRTLFIISNIDILSGVNDEQLHALFIIFKWRGVVSNKKLFTLSFICTILLLLVFCRVAMRASSLRNFFSYHVENGKMVLLVFSILSNI